MELPNIRIKPLKLQSNFTPSTINWDITSYLLFYYYNRISIAPLSKELRPLRTNTYLDTNY